MDRRTLLLAAATAPWAGAASAFGRPAGPEAVAEALARGDTVLVDFWASWCSTCRSQSRTMEELTAANPAYEGAITFIQVDWDQHGDSDLARRLNVPRRSTLVALKGDQEIGRVIAGTGTSQIQGLLDAALAASAD
ncbi:thiol-disulfide isomerase/thioredoxin [Hasllibacter halocynthiae]|uniref:Thiol-disulfide isomerase/thioredoxin n=1 Tax=Hasllibacter halocynthiae TaxID=595589 RepID=A0A2T0X359_9RHOB|nr:thioredoxin family protein [Hasllibacter halocynthiae]PRY93386.1 thiol-disulfide isomerase/thioredoxin [Hasllibacter halocynthiae]